MQHLLHAIMHIDLAATAQAAADAAQQVEPAQARTFFEQILHLDDVLMQVIQQSRGWAYAVIFGVIYAETGFVIFPFLPGDSFLFTLGVLSADPDSGMKVYFVIPLLITAAILGNSTNYMIGRWLGPKIFRKEGGRSIWQRALSRDKIDSAHRFFERHGGKAVTFAQFVPFMRCLVPFVAGMGKMDTSRFLFFNWLGAILWVGGFVGLGFATGNIPGIKNYTSEIFIVMLVAIFIIILTPPILYLSRKKKPVPVVAVVGEPGAGGEFLDTTSKPSV